MQISITNPKRDEVKALAIPWLVRLLNTPTLAGVDLPSGIVGYVYMDDQAFCLSHGTWQTVDSTLYLARESRSVDPLTRLGILAAVANLTNAVEDPAIPELLTSKLVTIIQQTTLGIHRALIRSTMAPTRLAINTSTFQAATEINGGWYLSSGTPVEVDSTWIIMDF